MTNGKARINRLETGVQGLDEVLGGGLPEFSFNVIAGPPGAQLEPSRRFGRWVSFHWD